MKIAKLAGSLARPRTVRQSRSLGALMLAGVLLTGIAACNKDEAPPPLPQAKPATTPTALQLQPPAEEDAGADKPAKKTGKGGGGKAQGTLGPCCAALRQNAANAPPETQAHLLNAAAACDAANAAGGAKSGFLGMLGGLLKGSGAPPACQ
jgi:hypothetical protein